MTSFQCVMCFCTFECTVWRACKAPSRVQWYSKLHPLVFSVFVAVWRAYKAPSRVQWYPKTASSRVQCVVFLICYCCRPHTRARISEKPKQKIRALSIPTNDIDVIFRHFSATIVISSLWRTKLISHSSQLQQGFWGIDFESRIHISRRPVIPCF